MALGLLAKLLATKQLRFEQGQIELKSIHMTLVPSFFIGELTKYFYREKQMPQFYLLSWLWGFKLVGEVVRDFHLNTPSKTYNLGMNLAEAMGIGIYKTCEYVAGRFTHFAISKNPYMKFFRGMEVHEPMDYFISGCMGGGGYFVHDNICQNIETKCILKGDTHCDFLTGTDQELKDRGLWEETDRRYGLDNIVPLQKEFLDAFEKGQEEEMIDDIIERSQRIHNG